MCFHIDKEILDSTKEKISQDLFSYFERPCITTYLNHTGRMGVDCHFINTEFIHRLAIEKNRPSFSDYHNLFTLGYGSSLLFGTHHIVELEYQGFFIAVDVAAEQYLNDGKTAAEITIANSEERLISILTERYQLQPRTDDVQIWMKNEVPKKQHFVNLLKIGRMELKPLPSQPKEDFSKDNNKEILASVKPSGMRCCIL